WALESLRGLRSAGLAIAGGRRLGNWLSLHQGRAQWKRTVAPAAKEVWRRAQASMEAPGW
ncbi:MAG: hypothetical protein ACK41W_04905, partial [Cyanobacteriota bacterium]